MSDKKFRFKTAKNQSLNSVDGFTPRRRTQLNKPQYYGGKAQITGGPRRALKQRQSIPAESLDTPLEEEDVLLLGDFDQPESNIFTDNQEKDLKKDEKADKKNDKKEKKGWWGKRSWKFKAGLVGGIAFIVLAGFAGIRLYSFLNSVFGRGVGNSSSAALNDCDRPEQLKTEGDCRFNVLLLGRGGEENVAPDLTDTIIVASIDLKNQSASMLSIPRDTWVTTNGTGTKINAVYALNKQSAAARGSSKDESEKVGIKAIIGIARDISGVPIHKYVLTDYKAFKDVVNALGGVTINNPVAIDDYFAGWHFPAGKIRMGGTKALQYARTRHGSARGDFDRNENQRRLLIAMRAKASSTGIVANPVKLNSIANAVQKNIRTDLSVSEAKKLFERTKDLPENKIKSLDLANPKGPLIRTGMVNGLSIVMPSAGAGNFSKIKAYARSNMLDPYLKSEAPTVAVYNGSGKIGLATSVGDVLASYGYKVVAKETSKTTQSKTLVVHTSSTKKRFTERFLTQRFKTVISNSLPSGVTASSSKTNTSAPQSDFVIVLGTNFSMPAGPTW